VGLLLNGLRQLGRDRGAEGKKYERRLFRGVLLRSTSQMPSTGRSITPSRKAVVTSPALTSDWSGGVDRTPSARVLQRQNLLSKESDRDMLTIESMVRAKQSRQCLKES
jgi:hypothetical protein